MRQPSRPSEEDKGANDDVLSRASISRSLGTPGTMQEVWNDQRDISPSEMES